MPGHRRTDSFNFSKGRSVPSSTSNSTFPLRVTLFLAKTHLKVKSLNLFEIAFTHKSFVNEERGAGRTSESNERLEYLGDSILSCIVNEYLFTHFLDLQEGVLTQLAARIVCESSLASVARSLEIGRFVKLGKGEAKAGGAQRDSILADCLEAVIAAIYLDQGFGSARRFVLQVFHEEMISLDSIVLSNTTKDSKSDLQEQVQKHLHNLPVYEKIHSEGPGHHKFYTVRVLISGREYGRGFGNSHKKAEQEAAKQALKKIEEDKDVFK